MTALRAQGKPISALRQQRIVNKEREQDTENEQTKREREREREREKERERKKERNDSSIKIIEFSDSKNKVCLGAGSAGLGVVQAIFHGMRAQDLGEVDAARNFWLVDKGRKNKTKNKRNCKFKYDFFRKRKKNDNNNNNDDDSESFF